MALKSTLGDIKSRLTALLTYANGVTGESDTNICDAIQTLADGYGQGGVEVYEATSGALYTKTIQLESTTLECIYKGCTELEEVTVVNATSAPQGFLYNNAKLRRVIMPKITNPSSYIIRQQGSTYNKLEEVQIGSVGYPVTAISNFRWRYGAHAMILNVTIYVDYTSVADIPSTITTNAGGDNSYAPSGSTVNVVYRNSTTGEVLS